MSRPDFVRQTTSALEDYRFKKTHEWTRQTNQALFDPAMVTFEESLLAEIESAAGMQGLWTAQPGKTPLLAADLARDFGQHAFLWPKTKADVVRELDESVRQVGWANIWTQPIINRVDMLATGVRTQLATKVLRALAGSRSRRSRTRWRRPCAPSPARSMSLPTRALARAMSKSRVDRERAARYGVSVGDVQDVIEVALGGKPITTTVEGRERYPVRLRYARDVPRG
ncbi:efflux RND transporter permease subunit [uncultured Desulfobulbus sp.]|uniref:efflux RND transporter permease subunit n=1 Tax=uncultured Desulfobulbus sp. TaxID=239745 RepID=UPI0029C91491|nr:efflux RND transporter permease subunit [uncultured Desulfobulbus sp.]